MSGPITIIIREGVTKNCFSQLRQVNGTGFDVASNHFVSR